MVARVTHYRIRPGKLEEFTATARSLTATIDAKDSRPGVARRLIIQR
jgi:hypothetical protein